MSDRSDSGNEIEIEESKPNNGEKNQRYHVEWDKDFADNTTVDNRQLS